MSIQQVSSLRTKLRDYKMNPIIFDNPQEEGIDLEFDLENGMSIKIFMDDELAQDFINIIQNKLNARK